MKIPTITRRHEALEVTHIQQQQTGMLLALGATGKHVYAGTVGGVEKARRRAKGKAQRAARKANR